MEYYPNSNKIMQFTYQLLNTAAQMVQKQFAVNTPPPPNFFFTKNNNYNPKTNNFLVSIVYIHACIISQCYYELFYYCFVLFIIID